MSLSSVLNSFSVIEFFFHDKVTHQCKKGNSLRNAISYCCLRRFVLVCLPVIVGGLTVLPLFLGTPVTFDYIQRLTSLKANWKQVTIERVITLHGNLGGYRDHYFLCVYKTGRRRR